MKDSPLITIAVPSFNQGQYLNATLTSIFSQDIPVEVFVLDNGSTDNSLEVIKHWETHLAGWRSHPDKGQSAAINEGINLGSAPYVCWLNSDDWLLPGGLGKLLKALEENADTPAVYGCSWNVVEGSNQRYPVWTEPFCPKRLAIRCIISQPATLIRRKAWEAVGGVDDQLHLAMDYDLWWKLYHFSGPLKFINEYIAVNRIHSETKTNTFRKKHYQEAIKVVRQHYGRVPWKWWLVQPYAVWYKSILAKL